MEDLHDAKSTWISSVTSLPPDEYTSIYNGTTAELISVFRYDHTACANLRLYLYGVFWLIACIAGLTGNTISYLVLKRDKSSPAASFILQTLAITDNMFLFIWMCHYPLHTLRLHFLPPAGDAHMLADNIFTVLQLFTHSILYITQCMTIWLTVVVALNRFTAVCLPYRAYSLSSSIHAKRQVIIVLTGSLLYNLPRLFEYTVINNNSAKYKKFIFKVIHTSFGANTNYDLYYRNYAYHIVTFVLPLIILAYVNTRIVVAFRQTRRRRRRMTSRRSDSNENNITLVMVLVVVLFMCCHAPSRVIHWLYNFGYDGCDDYRFYLMHFAHSLEAINSSINFLVYFMVRKRFREILCADRLCANQSTTSTQAHHNNIQHPSNGTPISRVTMTNLAPTTDIGTAVTGCPRYEDEAPVTSSVREWLCVKVPFRKRILSRDMLKQTTPLNNTMDTLTSELASVCTERKRSSLLPLNASAQNPSGQTPLLDSSAKVTEL